MVRLALMPTKSKAKIKTKIKINTNYTARPTSTTSATSAVRNDDVSSPRNRLLKDQEHERLVYPMSTSAKNVPGPIERPNVCRD